MSAGSQSNIRVVLRMRPEEASGMASPLMIADRNVAVFQQQQRFQFDDVLDGGATQQELYERVGEPLLKHALEGKHASLIAYGQSGSGKSHSVMGTPTAPGVVPQLCEELFRHLDEMRRSSNNNASSSSSTWAVALSIMEIYNENVRDLLGGNPNSKNNSNNNSAALPSLQLVTDAKTGAARPRDLTVVPVTSCGDVMQHVDAAMRRRATAATRLNEQSSRSHMIVQLELRETRRVVLTKDNRSRCRRACPAS
jgi:hypothetical protein